MPCYDSRTEQVKHDNYVKPYKVRLDAATRAACELAMLLPVPLFNRLSSEAQAWVKQHWQDDIARAKKGK